MTLKKQPQKLMAIISSKKNLFFFLMLLSIHSYAQPDLKKITMKPIITNHQVVIKGQTVNYTATVGAIAVKNKKDSIDGYVQFTYYKRKTNTPSAKRPIMFSFNGGPGSGSVWMHLAYTGPYVLNISEEGHPVQPYGYKKNPNSVLDVTDLVFINPISTGYSRTSPVQGSKELSEKFYGINADIKYLAEVLNTFVTKYDRWTSPKYLIGESYGGTRVSGLAYELQRKHWMYLNGVIMVSPADYKIYEADAPFAGALNLPYFAAAAWYHKKLPTDLQNKDLLDVLPEVEEFTIKTYLPALVTGGDLSDKQRDEIATQVAKYSGLQKQEVLNSNLNVSTFYYWKNLLKSERKTIGRLDSRYLGLEADESEGYISNTPEITTWLHAFTPAVNAYYKNVLNFNTDMKYELLSGVISNWNKENNRVRDQFRDAMLQNPFLHTMFQNGYYDGATNYFHSKYSMRQMNASGKLTDRMSFKGYRSGHMMYLRKEDLQQANADVREFILKSSKPGTAEIKR